MAIFDPAIFDPAVFDTGAGNRKLITLTVGTKINVCKGSGVIAVISLIAISLSTWLIYLWAMD